MSEQAELKWYVVHTYSGYENKVKVTLEKSVENNGLQDLICDVRIPTEEVTEIKSEKSGSEQESKDSDSGIEEEITETEKHASKKTADKKSRVKTIQRKLLPGYVLIKMVMTNESWYLVRNTRGVTGFVGSGNKPSPLSEEDFRKLFAVHTTTEIDIEVGDTVRILTGLFENFTGKVKAIDNANQKLTVTVPMLKRETDAEIGFTDVERVD